MPHSFHYLHLMVLFIEKKIIKVSKISSNNSSNNNINKNRNSTAIRKITTAHTSTLAKATAGVRPHSLTMTIAMITPTTMKSVPVLT